MAPCGTNVSDILKANFYMEGSCTFLGSTSLVDCSLSSSPHTSENFCRDRAMVLSFFFYCASNDNDYSWFTVMYHSDGGPAGDEYTRCTEDKDSKCGHTPRFVLLCFAALVFSTN